MVYRRRISKKTYKKRPYSTRPGRKYKRFPRKGRSAITYVNPIGTSNSLLVKLRYVETVESTTQGATPQNYQFRGNGPYDPYVGAGGNSCAYWDNYSALYSKYICYGSKIEVTFSNESTSYYAQAMIIPAVSTYTPGTNIDAISEQKYCKKSTLGKSNGGGGIKKLSGYSSTNRTYGVPKIALDIDDSYSAATTSTPTRQWYWNVIMKNISTTDDMTINARVQITYYVKFFDPILIDDN